MLSQQQYVLIVYAPPIAAFISIGKMFKAPLKTSKSASSTAAHSEPVDYYAVLGVQKDATRTDIKKASVSSSVL